MMNFCYGAGTWKEYCHSKEIICQKANQKVHGREVPKQGNNNQP